MTKKPNSRENPQILLSEHYSSPWKSALDNSTKVRLLLIVLLGLLHLTQHPFQTLAFSDNVYALRVLTRLDLMIAQHVGTLILCNQSKASRFSRSPRHSWLPLPTAARLFLAGSLPGGLSALRNVWWNHFPSTLQSKQELTSSIATFKWLLWYNIKNMAFEIRKPVFELWSSTHPCLCIGIIWKTPKINNSARPALETLKSMESDSWAWTFSNGFSDNSIV